MSKSTPNYAPFDRVVGLKCKLDVFENDRGNAWTFTHYKDGSIFHPATFKDRTIALLIDIRAFSLSAPKNLIRLALENCTGGNIAIHWIDVGFHLSRLAESEKMIAILYVPLRRGEKVANMKLNTLSHFSAKFSCNAVEKVVSMKMYPVDQIFSIHDRFMETTWTSIIKTGSSGDDADWKKFDEMQWRALLEMEGGHSTEATPSNRHVDSDFERIRAKIPREIIQTIRSTKVLSTLSPNTTNVARHNAIASTSTSGGAGSHRGQFDVRTPEGDLIHNKSTLVNVRLKVEAATNTEPVKYLTEDHMPTIEQTITNNLLDKLEARVMKRVEDLVIEWLMQQDKIGFRAINAQPNATTSMPGTSRMTGSTSLNADSRFPQQQILKIEPDTHSSDDDLCLIDEKPISVNLNSDGETPNQSWVVAEQRTQTLISANNADQSLEEMNITKATLESISTVLSTMQTELLEMKQQREYDRQNRSSYYNRREDRSPIGINERSQRSGRDRDRSRSRSRSPSKSNERIKNESI